MTHSAEGRNLVCSFEGFSQKAYQDQNGIWTIGFGHTGGVKEGDSCTYPQAVTWLDSDLEATDKTIAGLVKVPLNQNQWDALTSLVYNIGSGHFEHSTVLKLLNEGETVGAANAFLMWIKTNGKDNPGLLRRRTVERTLFLKPIEEGTV